MKTIKAYKLFAIRKDGTLHPLYIDINKVMPLNEWLTAAAGEKTLNGKIKSKLGELAYRPGFHTTAYPLATHIGRKMANGELCQSANTVWCEIEMGADHDYTDLAKTMGNTPRDQYLKTIPYNGYYKYKTNPSAVVDWYICDKIFITKVLSDDEVKSICKEAGLTAQITEKEYKKTILK